MKSQLRLEDCINERVEPEDGMPVLAADIGNIFSAHAVTDFVSFMRQPRGTRHHLCNCCMQHTGGMRFGHFTNRAYRKSDFRQLKDGSWQLTADWSKYPRGPAKVLFPARPRWQTFRYLVRSRGQQTVSITAAQVLSWHVISLQDSDIVFRPFVDRPTTRVQRQRWLRATFTAAFVASTVPPLSSAIKRITPHSFHAGFAVDLHMEGMELSRIARTGRWKSTAAVAVYTARAGFASLNPRARVYSITPVVATRILEGSVKSRRVRVQRR